ncbi:MAG: hypothetical protein A2992_00610 [Elusimicrobia bacterium RIFCSPLOWO2_01_FULL_59_12]|nr:MAG: hypothetical protein A2992_00610 [Elusimicrobia bacterium RIFCSPLOWO2_01_FULL_59_12]
MEAQALSSLAATFGSHMNRSATVRLVGWLVAGTGAAYGLSRLAPVISDAPISMVWSGFFAVVAVVVSAGSRIKLRPSYDRFYRDRKKQRQLQRRHHLFSRPYEVTWKDGGGMQRSRTMNFDIADTSETTIDQIYDVVVRFYEQLAGRGLLTENQIRLLERYQSNPKLLKRFIRRAVRNTPWTRVARGPSGHIEGVVFPAFGRGLLVNVLPDKMRGMTVWHTPYDSSPAEEEHIADYWVMAFDYDLSDGTSAMVEALLDRTVEMAQLLGIRRLFAYSNPVRFSTFSQKYPAMPIEEYADRALALPILKTLIASRVEIETPEVLSKIVAYPAGDVAVGDLASSAAERLLNEIQLLAGKTNSPEHLTPETYQHIFRVLFKPYDQGGYVISEPAPGVHLRRGARLARIIPDAFPPILGGPGIGGGYSFVLQYDIPPSTKSVERSNGIKGHPWVNLVLLGGVFSVIVSGVWIGRKLIRPNRLLQKTTLFKRSA